MHAWTVSYMTCSNLRLSVQHMRTIILFFFQIQRLAGPSQLSFLTAPFRGLVFACLVVWGSIIDPTQGFRLPGMTLNSETPCLHSWRLGYKCVLQSPSITNVKCAFHKGDLQIIKENLEKVKSSICCGIPRKRNVTLFSVIFLTMGYVSHQDFTKDTCWL